MKKKQTYTCYGSVCGGCDIHHRSIGAAQACCDRHQISIKNNNTSGAYSDRKVIRTDGQPLSDWEQEELDYIMFVDN